MTIKKLIDKVQEELPNTFTDEKLLSYVNEIETEAAIELAVEFEPYTAVGDTDLLVPEPYSRLYVSYLKAMIEFANKQYADYQLDQEQHIQDYRDFVDWVVREHVAVEHYIPKRVRNIM